MAARRTREPDIKQKCKNEIKHYSSFFHLLGEILERQKSHQIVVINSKYFGKVKLQSKDLNTTTLSLKEMALVHF